MGHFLQSRAWAVGQRELGRTVTELSGDGWSAVARLDGSPLASRLYVPYGPQLASADALRPAIEALRAEAKRLGAAYLRIEPLLDRASAVSEPLAVPPAELEALGFTRVEAVQPEHTQRIDLDRPFEQILPEMNSSSRNLHRNAHKKGLSVRESSDPADVEELLRLMHAVARRSEMSDPDDAYLGAQARAYLESGSAVVTLVELAGEPHPIAAALVYDDGTRRYYAHAAADDAHRRLSPGVVLVSNIIERAAAAGRQEFDLYGVVPPEVTDHAWSGFSKFKRAFGGYQVDYSGTWEIGVRPLRYAAYRLARRLRG